eukprot:TRINITY_DN4501_c0_g1_i3.p1 TRINITY_DN4501_c0_g1~~TRINITY_DN4501_c0_g1_i3.p1  ORF type:complete len:124 (-),score=13.01 TRINITY_DN4501_c0_g1_i3:87-458(-)
MVAVPVTLLLPITPFHFSLISNSNPRRFLPLTRTTVASPVSVSTSVILNLGESACLAASRSAFNRSRATGEIFLSSHVPAAFHLEPGDCALASATAAAAAASSGVCTGGGAACVFSTSRFQYV